MKTFPVNPFGAAAIFTVLAMGLIGLLLVLPVTLIYWSWNQFVPAYSILPPIEIWQAGLLYLASATLLFLSGIIQIEVEESRADLD